MTNLLVHCLAWWRSVMILPSSRFSCTMKVLEYNEQIVQGMKIFLNKIMGCGLLGLTCAWKPNHSADNRSKFYGETSTEHQIGHEMEDWIKLTNEDKLKDWLSGYHDIFLIQAHFRPEILSFCILLALFSAWAHSFLISSPKSCKILYFRFGHWNDTLDVIFLSSLIFMLIIYC